MDPNNHQKTLKINTQPVMCTPYDFVKRLTEEDIHVMITKDSIKTEHMEKCLDWSYFKNKNKKDSNLMTNDEMENGSFRKPTVSSSNISGNEKFQKSNQTNVNQKKKLLATSTAPCLSSLSSKIIHKLMLNNIKMENKTSYSHTISSPSSSGFQSSKKPMKRKLSNEQSYSHTIYSSPSSGRQSSKHSMQRKLSNVKLKNQSSTYVQFNGYSKNISKNRLSSEDLSCKIKVRDPKDMMELSMYNKYKINFQMDRITKHYIKNRTQKRNSNEEMDLQLRKLSNVKLKNQSSTYVQFNGYSKNISKNRPSSEDLSYKIKVRDPKDMMELSMYNKYKINFQMDRITKHSIKNRTQKRNSNDEMDLQLHQFTFLFDKYFGIPFQQAIVIMANIANASLLCENFYNEKKALFQRKIFNFGIFQDHKIVLVSRLQKCLEVILFSIDEYDVYNIALILFMCMLSIIPLLRVIHLDWNDTFKDLVQLFCNNLERSQPRFLKFINCIESHKFHSDCNNLIKLFDVAARLDYTMKSRMEIFFKPKNKLVDYFKRVICAILENSNDTEFLLSLVDESSRNVCDSYKFKEPQGIFLKNNPPTISKNTTNNEYKKPTYLRRSNKNTT